MKPVTAYLVEMMAKLCDRDFNALYEKNEKIHSFIVDWVDQAPGEQYYIRLDIVKAAFPNFNY